MSRRGYIALGISIALSLACAAHDVSSSEEPAAASQPSEEKKVKIGDVSATAKRSPQSDKAAQRLGLDLSSDAPLQVDARSAEMLEDGKGGESLRFRGDVKLTQGELKLTCDRLDAFFPEGRGQGRPQKVVASGDVQVVKGDFELQCTRATFEDANCIAVCLSSENCQSAKWPEEPARFRRGKDWIEGRELEFNQCTGKMFARCGARLSVAPKQDATSGASTPAAPAQAKPVPAQPVAAKPAPGTSEPAKPAAVQPEATTPAVTPP